MAQLRRLYIPYNDKGESIGVSEQFDGYPDTFCERCVENNSRYMFVNGVLNILKTKREFMVFYILQWLVMEKEEKGDCQKIDLKKYGFNISG